MNSWSLIVIIVIDIPTAVWGLRKVKQIKESSGKCKESSESGGSK